MKAKVLFAMLAIFTFLTPPPIHAKIRDSASLSATSALTSEVTQAQTETPLGMVAPWLYSSLPADGKWVECDGRTLNAAEYPEFVAQFGTKVPDLRDSMLVGKKSNEAAGAVESNDSFVYGSMDWNGGDMYGDFSPQSGTMSFSTFYIDGAYRGTQTSNNSGGGQNIIEFKPPLNSPYGGGGWTFNPGSVWVGDMDSDDMGNRREPIPAYRYTLPNNPKGGTYSIPNYSFPGKQYYVRHYMYMRNGKYKVHPLMGATSKVKTRYIIKVKM